MFKFTKNQEAILNIFFAQADDAALTRRFDRMRQKRNRFTYDEPGLLVSEQEITDAFALAKEFVDKMECFIQDQNYRRKLV